MRYILLLVATLCCGQAVGQSYPDGTLALSSSRGLIGRIAQRITGQKYTHVGIVLDGQVYDQDWPRSHRTPIARYVKPGWTTDFYVPAQPYTSAQVAAMRTAATARLGEPYRLRGFWDHSSNGTSGGWCSPYVAHVLNASDRYQLGSHAAWSPGNLHATVGHSYRFAGSVRR